MNKNENINNRCINCGHCYSPDEIIEIEHYDDCGIPEQRVYICYYCSFDVEKADKESDQT